MLPYLRVEDRVVSLNWFYNLKLNDLVVAKVNNRLIIKRVTKINQDKLFLEGDNKAVSIDSKSFGWIAKNKVIGKVIFSSF